MTVIQKLKQSKQLHKLSVYGFGQLFNLATPLLIIPYIVSLCGEENFGKTAISLSVFMFLIVFIDYGSDLAGPREASLNRDNIAALQKILLQNYCARLMNLVAVVLIAVIAFIYIPFFSKEQYMYIFGITILAGQYLSPVWFLQGIENVAWITLSNIISRCIYLAGVFLFLKTPGDYIYVNFIMGTGMIVGNAIFVMLLFLKYRVSLFHINRNDIKNYFSGNFSMFTAQFFTAVQLNAPVLLVGFFGSNLLAGQYRIIEQIILMFKTYIFLLFNFLFPKVCYLVQLDKKRGLKVWLMYNAANLVFVTTSMCCFWFLADYIVGYFNAKNTEYMSDILKIAIFIPIFMAVGIGLKQLVLAWNHTKRYFHVTVFTVVITLTSIIGVLPLYGIKGVFYLLIFYELLLILFYLAIIWNNIWGEKNHSTDV